MPTCFFVSDLHGHAGRYHALFDTISAERPAAVFFGGDLLPSGVGRRGAPHCDDFVRDFFERHLTRLREHLGTAYPRMFLILGNDDPRSAAELIDAASANGLCEHIHQRRVSFRDYDVYGYACVPPTPFLLKDWERYDVSRYIDPGCVSPEEGHRTVPVRDNEIRYSTIAQDLDALVGQRDLSAAIMLFHTPPYETKLDRAALDGKLIDHVPLDVHVGSVAVRRLIEQRRPYVTLHGHIHESARLTGNWREVVGETHCFSAAHDDIDELALVRFDPANPATATRSHLPASTSR